MAGEYHREIGARAGAIRRRLKRRVARKRHVTQQDVADWSSEILGEDNKLSRTLVNDIERASRRPVSAEAVGRYIEVLKAIAGGAAEVEPQPDLVAELDGLLLSLSLVPPPAEKQGPEEEKDPARLDRSGRARRAATLSQIAKSANAAYRFERAAEAATEAIAQFRDLEIKNPGRYEQSLAVALNHLAFALGRLNRGREAVSAAEESVEIRRRMHKPTDPESARHLSSALHNLAGRYHHVKRYAEALGAALEALEQLDQAQKGNPKGDYRPDRAAIYHHLATVYAALRRKQEAKEAAQQALELKRALVVEKRLPVSSLIYGLQNLAERLTDLEHHELAHELLEEVLRLEDQAEAEAGDPQSNAPPVK